MGLKTIADVLYSGIQKYVTRIGADADLRTFIHTHPIFRIAGGDIALLGIYGKVTVAKDAGVQTLQLTHTVGGPLCIASAATNGLVAHAILCITGVVGAAMIETPLAGAGTLAIGQWMAGLTGSGIGNLLVLTVGDINLVTGAAADATGFIDWTILYRPLSPVSVVTALP